MATFGKAAFNTAVYGSFRPTYPRQLFDFIFDYHGRSRGARWDVAIDLGCGTGQATTELTPFKRVIGVDPSTSMLTQARQHTASLGLDGTNQFSFVQSAAEDLRFLENDSVDLIVSSQASHWFDWNKFWPEAARVLRSGGTTAHWIYSEFRLSQHPSLTPIITEYAQGTDPATSLGPHFQRPGRTILENHLLDVPTALDVTPGKFQEYSPVYFTGPHYPDLPYSRPVILRKKMTWSDLQSYFRTWSALLTYHEKYPKDLEHPEGDIATRFWNNLRVGVAKDGGSIGETDMVDVEWPLAMILARRA